jgi:DNA-binding beta-propeller fold protein YncE
LRPKVRGRLEKRVLWGLAMSVLFVSAAAAGCSRPVTYRTPVVKISPVKIFPTDAYLRAVSNSAGAFIWVVAGRKSSMTLSEYSTVKGERLQELPVPSDTTSVADTGEGVVVYGVGAHAKGVGYVVGLSAIGASELWRLPMPGPVLGLYSQAPSQYVIALVGNYKHEAIVGVDAVAGKVVSSLPIPNSAVQVTIGSDPSSYFALLSDGSIVVLASQSGGVQSSVFKAASSARAIALSPDGRILYVLQCGASFCNVKMVDTATEGDIVALPAPLGTVALSVSLDGSYLYDAVGQAPVSNIQKYYVAGVL